MSEEHWVSAKIRDAGDDDSAVVVLRINDVEHSVSITDAIRLCDEMSEAMGFSWRLKTPTPMTRPRPGKLFSSRVEIIVDGIKSGGYPLRVSQPQTKLKTIVTLQSQSKSSRFIVNGRPSDISDKIIRIKRALKLRINHGTQAL